MQGLADQLKAMDRTETLLEMARRHVDAGTLRVDQQAALVDRPAEKGFDTARAESLLVALQQTLALMQLDLARLQAQADLSATLERIR